MTRQRTSEPGAAPPRPASATAPDRDPDVADHDHAAADRQPQPEDPREDPEQEWRDYINGLKRDRLADSDILLRAQVITGRKGEVAAMHTIHGFFSERHTEDPVRKRLLRYSNAAADLRDTIDTYFPRERVGNDLRPEMTQTLAAQLLKQNAAEDITTGIGSRYWVGPPPHLQRAAAGGPTPLPQATYDKRVQTLNTHLYPLTERRHNNHIASRWDHVRPSLQREIQEIEEAVMILVDEGLPVTTVRSPDGKLKMDPTFARRDLLTMVRAIADTKTGSALLLHGARPDDVDRFARMVDPSLIPVDGMYFSERSDSRQATIRRQDLRGIEPLLEKLRRMDDDDANWVARLRAEQETAAARQQQEVARSFAANMRALAEASAEENRVRRSMNGAGWRGSVLKLLSVVGMYPPMNAVRGAKKDALRALHDPKYKDLRGDPQTLEDRAHDLLLLEDTRQLSPPATDAGEASVDTAPAHSAAPRPRQRQ